MQGSTHMQKMWSERVPIDGKIASFAAGREEIFLTLLTAREQGSSFGALGG
jgi:hypothetical protein